MKIFPAIDIKDKKCVRLVKGDFDNKTEYEMSPVEQAGKYNDHGFKNLHIVDLDGEILGHTINPQTGFPIQTDVLSVSVLSNSCMESDAWATALMAMNYQTGYSMVESQSNIDAIWILFDNNDGKRYFSKSGDIDIKKMIYPLM